MAAEIKWLGHASFRISDGNSVVYIDPWKIDCAPRDGNVVLVSHSHHDHCSPKDVRKVSADDATFAEEAPCPVTILRPGETIDVKPAT
jgi:L-ascorbate metabolism protein UlaG (beta-lactamase superfamily)